MNEKKAREILRNHDAFGHFEDIDGHGRARGYLEAIDKARGLEEGLRRIRMIVKNTVVENSPFQGLAAIADETLAKWRKEK